MVSVSKMKGGPAALSALTRASNRPCGPNSTSGACSLRGRASSYQPGRNVPVRGTQYNSCRVFCTTHRVRQADPSSLGGTKNNLPLSGITVVSLEQAIAGPFCTRQLADLGARVIKVERPGRGDFNRDHDQRVKGLCSHFVWTNRSKESVALDLKQPQDLAALRQIVAKSDVLVQNLAPGATERMGLGFGTLKAQHPSLIVCDISGYGSTGPYKNKKAYDLLIQSESGWVSSNRW